MLGGPTDLVVALDGNDDKIAYLPSDEEFAEGLKSSAVPQGPVSKNKKNKGRGRGRGLQDKGGGKAGSK